MGSGNGIGARVSAGNGSVGEEMWRPRPLQRARPVVTEQIDSFQREAHVAHVKVVYLGIGEGIGIVRARWREQVQSKETLFERRCYAQFISDANATCKCHSRLVLNAFFSHFSALSTLTVAGRRGLGRLWFMGKGPALTGASMTRWPRIILPMVATSFVLESCVVLLFVFVAFVKDSLETGSG